MNQILKISSRTANAVTIDTICSEHNFSRTVNNCAIHEFYIVNTTAY